MQKRPMSQVFLQVTIRLLFALEKAISPGDIQWCVPLEQQVVPVALAIRVRARAPARPFLELRFRGLIFAAQWQGKFLARLSLGSPQT